MNDRSSYSRGGRGQGRSGKTPARATGSGRGRSPHRSGRNAGGQPPRTGRGQHNGRARAVEKAPTADVHREDGIRLQKVLATAGHGSRRACEQLITQGRVKVDGHVVRELGTRVNPHESVIHVDGLRIIFDESLVTLALNKPVGVYCTMKDEQGRPDLQPYVADWSERLFHVGRLDAETDGLLLLTNDGELANRLMHPSYEVPKTYVATVDGKPRKGLAKLLADGIELEDGPVYVDKFSVLDSTPHTAIVELTLHEGRNHIVRRLLEEVGLPVTTLTRTRLGTIRLGHLKVGRTRVIEGRELAQLMASVGL